MFESMVFFSAIITTYNSENYIKKALDSVLNQTYKNFEIIVIDNESKDQTQNIVRAYNDRRIRLLTTNNMGVIARSRNIGIKLAAGEWVGFLDSDDSWHSEKIEKIYYETKQNNAVQVYENNEVHINLEKNTQKKVYYGPFNDKLFKKMLYEGSKLSTSATVINKHFLLENRLFFNESEKFKTAEDYELWLRIAKINAKIKVLNDIDGLYLIRSNSASSRHQEHKKAIIAVVLEHTKDASDYCKKDILNYINFRLEISIFFGMLTSKHKFKCLQNIFEAGFRHPIYLIRYFRSKIL
jgi:glycosyltransferase involved in cell wall biosynthesis